MGGYPREHVKNKGFWDGGTPEHGMNGESGGKASGFPGMRKHGRQGVKTDLEFPDEEVIPGPTSESRSGS